MEDLLNPSKIREKTIDDACDRIQALSLINVGRTEEERQQAIKILIESRGLTQETVNRLQARFDYAPKNKRAALLIGVLIGIDIAEDYYSNEDSSVPE